MSAPPTDSGLIVFCGKGGVGNHTGAGVRFGAGGTRLQSRCGYVAYLSRSWPFPSRRGLEGKISAKPPRILYITYIEAREVLNHVRAVSQSAILERPCSPAGFIKV